MEWWFIKSAMKDCVETVEALAGVLSQMEEKAKELQKQKLNSPSNPNETFARDIYNAISPIFEKKIIAIQTATIKELSEKIKPKE